MQSQNGKLRRFPFSWHTQTAFVCRLRVQNALKTPAEAKGGVSNEAVGRKVFAKVELGLDWKFVPNHFRC